MPTGHNQRFRATKRRQEVAEFYLQGWSQLAIAEKLGVTQSTVSNDLEKVQAELLAFANQYVQLFQQVAT